MIITTAIIFIMMAGVFNIAIISAFITSPLTIPVFLPFDFSHVQY